MSRYAVALGSNLGDRRRHLHDAVSEMRRLGAVEAISSLFETAPVGGSPQEDYLNAVVVLISEEQPAALLAALNRIEDGLGRDRGLRWGPRTIDLDIVAWDGEPVTTKEVTIPHPRAQFRRFVVEPLWEVWPAAALGPGVTAADALSSLADQEVERVTTDWANRP